MNLKSKLFGTLAAATVALSMMGGVASAETKTIDVNVSLNEAPACSLAITKAEGTFGTWVYNGDTNTYTKPNDTRIDFEGSIFETKPGGKCDVTLGFTGLMNSSNAVVIPVSHFKANAFGYTVNSVPATSVPVGFLPGGDYAGYLELQSLPTVGAAHTLAPNTYGGTVSVTVGAAQ